MAIRHTVSAEMLLESNIFLFLLLIASGLHQWDDAIKRTRVPIGSVRITLYVGVWQSI